MTDDSEELTRLMTTAAGHCLSGHIVCLDTMLLLLASTSPDGSRYPARQNGDFGRNFSYFLLIFCLWYPICRSSAHMFMEFAYFCIFPSIYFRLFPPKMVSHPCYKLKYGIHLLFFRPHVYLSTFFVMKVSKFFGCISRCFI